MLAANVLLQITWLYVWGVVAVAVGAFVARVLVVFGMLPVLEMSHLVQPVDKRYKAILVWGGLRGAVTIVLAMVAASDDRLSDGCPRVHRACWPRCSCCSRCSSTPRRSASSCTCSGSTS